MSNSSDEKARLNITNLLLRIRVCTKKTLFIDRTCNLIQERFAVKRFHYAERGTGTVAFDAGLGMLGVREVHPQQKMKGEICTKELSMPSLA